MSKSKVVTTKDSSAATREDGAKIEVDLNACIAAGPCAVVAEKTFGIRDQDGKAIIVDPDGDSLETVIDAAKACPVKAIIIKDKTGKQLYP